MTDSDEKQRGLDATMENESSRDLSPMVQISLREYDKLKERSRYITDKDLISMIDKLEFFVKELRKHIVRIDICLLYTSPSPRDLSTSRMPSSA